MKMTHNVLPDYTKKRYWAVFNSNDKIVAVARTFNAASEYVEKKKMEDYEIAEMKLVLTKVK